MCKRVAIEEWARENEIELVFLDDFDDALVGIGNQHGSEPAAIYDRDMCINILLDQADADDDEDPLTAAIDYFEFNIAGAYVGPHTPIFIETF